MRYTLDSFLPLGAFEHCGNRHIKLHGGGGGGIGGFLAAIDPIEAVKNVANSTADAGFEAVDWTSENGWMLPIALVAGAYAAGEIIGEAAVAGSTGAVAADGTVFAAGEAVPIGTTLSEGTAVGTSGAAGTATAGAGESALSTTDILGSGGFTPSTGSSFAVQPSVLEQAATGAAKGAATGGAKNAITGGDVLQGAALGALSGGVGAGISGAIDSGTIGNIIGSSAAGGVNALATGRDPVTGLLSGAAGGTIGAGVNAGVNAVADSGLFNNVVSQTNTGNTSMDELFGPTYADLGYDPYANLNAGDAEAQAGGFYGGVTPDNPYTNMSDDQIAAAIAAQSGTDNSTALGLVKSLGSSVVKALLGGTATAAQRYAASNLLGNSNNGLLSSAGNYLLNASQLGQLRNSYAQNVAGQQQATQQAIAQAGFTPVGTTTAFGQSNFGFDPTTGKLTSAGYTATPTVAAQREKLFGLGAQALPTTADTQAIQQQYIAQQQGLLAPGREQQLAQLSNRQFQTGRTGLATGGTMAGYAPGQQGLMQTNPELAAYYNSLAQQDAQLAANAPTYAQNQLNAQIATGTGLFGAANTLEGYAQQPLALSSALGTAASTAGAKAGYYGLLGNQSALQTQLLGQQQNIYGTGQAIGSAVNPLLTAAQGGLSTAIGNWLS
jgi:hypothetical protein